MCVCLPLTVHNNNNNNAIVIIINSKRLQQHSRNFSSNMRCSSRSSCRNKKVCDNAQMLNVFCKLSRSSSM